jgi:hypothetical protein
LFVVKLKTLVAVAAVDLLPSRDALSIPTAATATVLGPADVGTLIVDRLAAGDFRPGYD